MGRHLAPAGSRRRPPATGQALALTLDRGQGAPPLYRQVRDGVRAAVVSGALGAGMRLPPERELAAALGVDRTTVTRAYQELAADGVVEAQASRGTIVCLPEAGGAEAGWMGAGSLQATPEAAWLLGLPAVGGGNAGPDPGLLRDIAALTGRADLISFAGGTPGHDLVPAAALQAALGRALAATGAPGLSYGPVEGLEALRVAIAERLAGRGVRTNPTEILVTAGAMQALTLTAQALIEPGDEVVVEAPSFMGTLQTFSAAGARLLPVPLDGDGLRVDLLERLLARRRVRLILVQPTHHNPTGVTLAPARREVLVAMARRHGVPVLEDDAYGELWHEGQPPLPLKALDRGGMVLHVGTFSKTVAPGLRVGWVAAPAPVIARLTLAKELADLTTGALPQLALADFLASGYDSHLATVRRAYAARRAAMLGGLEALRDHLVAAPGPPGGFYLWCRLLAGPRARLLAAGAARAGVALLAGEVFYPRTGEAAADGADRVRLSFSGHTPEMIGEGLRRLRPVLEALPSAAQAAPARGLRPVV